LTKIEKENTPMANRLGLRALFLSTFFLLTTSSLFSQTYDLRFLVAVNDAAPGGNFDATVQIKANDLPFGMGTSNLVFTYNVDAMTNPTLLTAHHYSGGNYLAMTVTEPQAGRVSINIELLVPATGEAVPDTFFDVVTIRFQILAANSTTGMAWRIAPPNRTVVFKDDDATIIPAGTLTGLDVPFLQNITGLAAAKNGRDLVLTWNAMATADSFVVYRGTTPMFAVTGARLGATTVPTYTDANILGDPSVNHFYAVRPYFGSYAGPLSTEVGEFEWRLLAPVGKKNNFISLCLADTALKNASDLATRIGPNCDLVSRWIETSQAYGSYIPGLAFTDFPLEVNEVYMVSVTTEDTLCLAGSVPTGHHYALITNASGKNNNGIMLLMDMGHLTLASQLATDIGTVDLISRWNAAAQAYGSYVPGLAFTDFPIFPGQPLMVSVTTATTWP